MGRAMDAVQAFQKRVEELASRIQKNTLPAEKKVAKCVYDCYDTRSEYEAVHQCVKQCEDSMKDLGQTLQGEMESLQGSVQSCQQSCMKRLEPRAQAAQSDPQLMAQLQAELEEGTRRCIKEAEPLLPEMEKRIMYRLRQAY